MFEHIAIGREYLLSHLAADETAASATQPAPGRLAKRKAVTMARPKKSRS